MTGTGRREAVDAASSLLPAGGGGRRRVSTSLGGGGGSRNYGEEEGVVRRCRGVFGGKAGLWLRRKALAAGASKAAAPEEAAATNADGNNSKRVSRDGRERQHGGRCYASTDSSSSDDGGDEDDDCFADNDAKSPPFWPLSAAATSKNAKDAESISSMSSSSSRQQTTKDGCATSADASENKRKRTFQSRSRKRVAPCNPTPPPPPSAAASDATGDEVDDEESTSTKSSSIKRRRLSTDGEDGQQTNSAEKDEKIAVKTTGANNVKAPRVSILRRPGQKITKKTAASSSSSSSVSTCANSSVTSSSTDLNFPAGDDEDVGGTGDNKNRKNSRTKSNPSALTSLSVARTFFEALDSENPLAVMESSSPADSTVGDKLNGNGGRSRRILSASNNPLIGREYRQYQRSCDECGVDPLDFAAFLEQRRLFIHGGGGGDTSSSRALYEGCLDDG